MLLLCRAVVHQLNRKGQDGIQNLDTQTHPRVTRGFGRPGPRARHLRVRLRRLDGQRRRELRRLGQRQRQPGRLLDPAGRLREGPRAGLPGRRRRRRRVLELVRRLRRSVACGRGGPAGRPRPLRARARHEASRRRRSRRLGLDRQQVQGHRPGVGGGLHRPQGQSAGHPGLGRPRPRRRRGHHPEPVHLGRCALEHHGRLRRPDQPGQVRGRGAAVRRRHARATPPFRIRAHRTRWRRSAPARATS